MQFPEPLRPQRIALVTDFGPGIYLGQTSARLAALAPGVPVTDLVHDLPPFRPDLAAYLLPALVRDMPRATLYLCVVDPGVGGTRAGLVASAGGNVFVAPDNGLLARVLAGAPDARPDAHVEAIAWQPERLSPSFHGRDWFAPAAARLCLGEPLPTRTLEPADMVGSDWPGDLPAAIYIDRYGNVMTGLAAARLPADAALIAAGRRLARARTFCEVPEGEPFWYENALGLAEIAVNRDRADRLLGLSPGDPVTVALGPDA